MSKIVCPVDFSETSLNAVEFAAHIAATHQYNLNLIHVFTEKEYNKIVNSKKISLSFNEMKEEARAKLTAIAAEVMEQEKHENLPSCEAKVVSGDLQDMMLEISNESDCEMIVMGTTGKGGSIWMGSNTSLLISKSIKPVFCVPSMANFEGFSRVVYATDIQEEDKLRIQEVVSFATVFNSRVYVVHMSQHNEELEKNESNDFFEELKSFVTYRKLTFENKYYEKSLSNNMLKYLNETNSSLLVLYSKNRNFVENLFHKSLTKELSEISNHPILVLK